MLRFFTTFIIFIFIQNSFGQSYIVNGVITNKKNEPLPGANIWNPELKKGTISELNGNYYLSLPKGNNKLIISFISYNSDTISLFLNRDTTINIELNEIKINQINTITISEKKDNQNLEQHSGELKLDIKTSNNLPEVLGESDIMRSFQLSSGVNSSAEMSGGLIVRGGEIDQTLFKIDNATIYNPTHLSGLFSVFNSDILKSATIYKGNIPARYGGRLSSIADIQLREGNKEKASGDISIGLLSSKLTIETPIVKNKHSLIISGRKTYLDEIIKPSLSPIIESVEQFFEKTSYSFYDLNVKLALKLSDNDKLTATYLIGNDLFKYTDRNDLFNANMNWGNSILALNYNHIFNSKTYLKAHLNWVEYNQQSYTDIQDYSLNITSIVKDNDMGIRLYYIPNNKFKFNTGIDYTIHQILPNDKKLTIIDNEVDFNDQQNLRFTELNPYLTFTYKTDKFVYELGARSTFFARKGPYSYFNTSSLNVVTDTIIYNKGKSFNQDFSISPRFSFLYKKSKKTSIKGSISHMNQYMHLTSISSIALPIDFWVPATDKLPKELSNQYSIGISHNLKKNKYKLSTDLYYKSMDNLTEYEDGIIGSTILNNFDDGYTLGKGESYGIELEAEKSKGTLTGKLSCTFSKSLRSFEDINNGIDYPSKYDHPIDISLYFIYEINSRLKLSSVFIYTSGNNTTLPASRYMLQGSIMNTYNKKNSYRLPSYHRMDISLTYKVHEKKKIESYCKFSVYNVYNHDNPFFMVISAEGDIKNYNLNVSAKQANLLPIMPSITWSSKF